MGVKARRFLRVAVCSLALGVMSNVPASLAEEEHPKVDSKHWTSKYDRYFRKYSKRFFGPGFNWKWFKAQAIAESGLKADAKSWVRAKGLMQIMPRTFEEIQKKNPSFADLNEPRWNIAAGIYYNHQQFERWKGLAFDNRLRFTFASYNAGYGTMRRAQELSKREGLGGNTWKDIKAVARKVSRWRYKETLNYIEKITGMMRE